MVEDQAHEHARIFSKVSESLVILVQLCNINYKEKDNLPRFVLSTTKKEAQYFFGFKKHPLS